jgi:hypothetical protein
LSGRPDSWRPIVETKTSGRQRGSEGVNENGKKKEREIDNCSDSVD